MLFVRKSDKNDTRYLMRIWLDRLIKINEKKIYKISQLTYSHFHESQNLL